MRSVIMYSTPATAAASPPHRIRFEDDTESSLLARTFLYLEDSSLYQCFAYPKRVSLAKELYVIRGATYLPRTTPYPARLLARVYTLSYQHSTITLRLSLYLLLP